jgi:hypothetical protein
MPNGCHTNSTSAAVGSRCSLLELEGVMFAPFLREPSGLLLCTTLATEYMRKTAPTLDLNNRTSTASRVKRRRLTTTFSIAALVVAALFFTDLAVTRIFTLCAINLVLQFLSFQPPQISFAHCYYFHHLNSSSASLQLEILHPTIWCHYGVRLPGLPHHLAFFALVLLIVARSNCHVIGQTRWCAYHLSIPGGDDNH